MATISKVPSGWLCQIRKKGYPNKSKTFATRADALTWGNQIEAEMGRGLGEAQCS